MTVVRGFIIDLNSTMKVFLSDWQIFVDLVEGYWRSLFDNGCD